MTNQADQKCNGKPRATPWTTEQLEYLFLQSSSRIHIVKTKSRSWSRSSRATSTRNPSFRTWARRRRSTSSAKNRRISSLTWTTQRSSSFAKHLPNRNALIAIYTGRSRHCLLYLWKMRKNIVEWKRRSTRATTMSCRYLAMLSRRITSAAPDMDLPNDNECITRLKICCTKLVKRNMEDIHPFLRGGTTNTVTEIRWHALDGLSRTSCYLTELPWKIIHTSQQELREFETQNIRF